MEDNRVIKYIELGAPEKIKKHYPLKDSVKKFIDEKRVEIKKVINGIDNRILVIVGPCSIHDTEAAMDYAKRLKVLIDRYKDTLLIVMRVYFEKPRTTVGWKGLINDPDMDGSNNINKGLLKARKLLIELNEMGVPAGCELLDTVIPQYLSDLISWGAIGARTVESQIHRELVSGVSFPIGFKNGTNGDVNVALNAVISSRMSHTFVGITNSGIPAIVSTSGNEDCHIILRGSNNGANYMDYDKYDIRLMIDCSHGNSNKDYRKQKDVVKYVGDEIIKFGKMNKVSKIFGLMLESNIYEGSQKLSDNLEYGISITDSCISFEETDILLLYLSKVYLVSRNRLDKK
jgi:3-deoxy-7-phosphoheptulonate synthase